MEHISVEHRRALDGSLKIAAIIVLAYCISVGVFALIMLLIKQPEIIPGSERFNSAIPVLVIVLTVIVIILRRFWLSGLIMRMAVRSGVPATLQRLSQMSIICGALSLMVAIAGLMFYFLTGNYRYGLILCLVSVLLIFYTAFPRRREWDRAIAAAANSRI